MRGTGLLEEDAGVFIWMKVSFALCCLCCEGEDHPQQSDCHSVMVKGPGAPAEGLRSWQCGPQSPWREKEEARVDRWWGSRKEPAAVAPSAAVHRAWSGAFPRFRCRVRSVYAHFPGGGAIREHGSLVEI